MDFSFSEIKKPGNNSEQNLSLSSVLINDLQSLPSKVSTAVNEASRSAIYAAVQTPISGLAEVWDRTAGTDLAPKVQFLNKPDDAQTPLEQGARTAGAVIGSLAPLLVVHKAMGSTSRLMLADKATVLSPALSTRSVLESAMTGAICEGLLRPVEKEKTSDFIMARLGNAATGAATFSAMTACMLSLRGSNLAQRLEPMGLGTLGKAARSQVGSAIIAGIPGGAVHANMDSLTHKGRLASFSEAAVSMGSFAVLGGLLAKGGQRLPSNETPTMRAATQKAAPVESTGRSHFDGSLPARTGLGLEIEPPDSKFGSALVDYSDAVAAKGLNSPEALAIKGKHAASPEFLDLSRQVDKLDSLFTPKHNHKPSTAAEIAAEVPFSEESAAALEKYAQLMDKHGPLHAIPEAFFQNSKSLPEFAELARECQRLELLAAQQRAARQGRPKK